MVRQVARTLHQGFSRGALVPQIMLASQASLNRRMNGFCSNCLQPSIDLYAADAAIALLPDMH